LRALLVAIVAIAAFDGPLGSMGNTPAFAETTGPICSLYASTGGSDSNPGSATAPLRTVLVLIHDLRAGQIGCLAAGQTFDEGITLHEGESHGAAGAPVTITSTNPADPALINGRFVTESGADWLTLSHLRFADSEHGPPSVTVGSQHTTWVWDDITASSTICFNLVSGQWGTAENTLIEHDRIHNCGSLDKFICNENTVFCSTAPNDGFFIHGVYIGGGKETTIRNNYIYENADRGVQVRAGSSGVIVEHNIIDGNGEGIIFGDGATNVTAKYNVITNSHSPCGQREGCYDYGAGEYEAVAPNTLADNDVYDNQCSLGLPLAPLCYPNEGNIEAMTNVATEHNVEVDPQYVNASEHNYTLQATSPVLGYGPDTAQPNSGLPGPEPPTEQPPTKQPPTEQPPTKQTGGSEPGKGSASGPPSESTKSGPTSKPPTGAKSGSTGKSKSKSGTSGGGASGGEPQGSAPPSEHEQDTAESGRPTTHHHPSHSTAHRSTRFRHHHRSREADASSLRDHQGRRWRRLLGDSHRGRHFKTS
jgi:hypothetical protein